MTTPDGFDHPDLLARLESLSPAQLDDLDLGIVRMDAFGTVVGYNRVECKRSGLTPEQVLGRHFFTEVAPCTNNYLVAQRYIEAETLDETRDYVFTVRIAPTPVRLRMLKAPGTSQYLVVDWSVAS